MKAWILGPLLAGTLAGVVGFGIGRAASGRHARNPTPGLQHVAREKLGVQAELRSAKSTVSNTPASTHGAQAETGPPPDIQSRFLDLMLPVFVDDDYRLRKCMFSVTLRNARAQDAVLDLVQSLEDRATLEDCAALLTY